jgi:hypothetical protein
VSSSIFRRFDFLIENFSAERRLKSDRVSQGEGSDMSMASASTTVCVTQSKQRKNNFQPRMLEIEFLPNRELKNVCEFSITSVAEHSFCLDQGELCLSGLGWRVEDGSSAFFSVNKSFFKVSS